MKPLLGKRILVVEDEAIVALMVEDILDECGAIVVGSARTIEDGMAIAESAHFDAAVLDVNVRGLRVDPIVEKLTERGIPYLLATGYDKVEFANGQAALHIEKPYTPESLANGLSKALGVGSQD